MNTMMSNDVYSTMWTCVYFNVVYHPIEPLKTCIINNHTAYYCIIYFFQVVKVVGGNISHKLRLSSVKLSDEGTYECRVIDLSGTVAQHHRVHAHLQVEPESSQGSDGVKQQEAELRSHANLRASRHQAEGMELMRSGSTSDCIDSCTL